LWWKYIGMLVATFFFLAGLGAMISIATSIIAS
jgi:hypothetical protein